MRRDGAAGVEFGVDERAQLRGCFDGGVQVEAELAEDVQVRAEAGAGQQDVGLKGPAIDRSNGEVGVEGFEGTDAEAAEETPCQRLANNRYRTPTMTKR